MWEKTWCLFFSFSLILNWQLPPIFGPKSAAKSWQNHGNMMESTGLCWCRTGFCPSPGQLDTLCWLHMSLLHCMPVGMVLYSPAEIRKKIDFFLIFSAVEHLDCMSCKFRIIAPRTVTSQEDGRHHHCKVGHQERKTRLDSFCAAVVTWRQGNHPAMTKPPDRTQNQADWCPVGQPVLC